MRHDCYPCIDFIGIAIVVGPLKALGDLNRAELKDNKVKSRSQHTSSPLHDALRGRLAEIPDLSSFLPIPFNHYYLLRRLQLHT